MSTTTTTHRGHEATAEAQSLTLRRLFKTYVARGREPFEAVKGIDLHIEPGDSWPCSGRPAAGRRQRCG